MVLRRRRLGIFVALEQRIALEFRLDERVEFEVRQLQQPDRLLQLRRHHQLLALPELEACRKRHRQRPCYLLTYRELGVQMY